MSKRSDQLLLADILLSIRKTQKYVKGLTFQSFSQDDRTIDAVTRNLEIIGEAAKRISDGFKAEHASIEWHKMIGLRNRIVHDYFGIDLNIVWDTVVSYIPALKKTLSVLSPRRSARRGVTLMELLLVVALLAIVAAVGAPQVYNNLVGGVEKRIVWAATTDFEYARSMGLSDAAAYADVEITAGSSQYQVATLTKMLDGEATFSAAAAFRFGATGTPELTPGKAALFPTFPFTVNVQSPAGAKIGEVTIAANGFITWK
ncbi:MAG TPA: DUF86 domain-containing protein [Candidatus Ozemobacteraceae bacterium]|nr:DUF86 domain-containing protein [Candidatus Ozemobacteraceae bacterium]